MTSRRMLACTVGGLLATGPALAFAQESSHAEAPQVDLPSAQRAEAGDVPRDLVVPRPNQGHFMSVALLSTGALGIDSERPNRSLTPGIGVNVQLGESVTDWLDLGLGFTLGETFGADADRLAFGRLSLHSQWYLDPLWFARLDLGAGSIAGKDPHDVSVDRGGYSYVWAAGVGRNFFLSPGTQSGGWVLSPVLGVDVTPANGLTAVIGWVGLEVSFWTGLTKDKLLLPLERAYE